MSVDVDVDGQVALVRGAIAQLLDGNPPRATPFTEFLAARYDLGLAWVHFPPGYGGLGVDPDLQRLVGRELRAAGAPWDPDRNPIGLGLAAPTIVVHGTDTQRQRFLRSLFTNNDIWCQLFSEPGAGSDLAAVGTRAVRDGDEWVVSGQKVWTTLAHQATRALLLARTAPDAPKHRGLTYFALDMRSPGVEVRPLRQMTGDAEFNEVFLDSVRVPDQDRIGEPGDGWRVALTTLMNERASIGGAVRPRGSGPIGEAVRLFQARDALHEGKRDRLVHLWVRAEVLRLTAIRARQLKEEGTPGPEGAIGKLARSELIRDIAEFAVELLGPEGQLYPGWDMTRPERMSGDDGDPRYRFLRSRAGTIEDGTSEILRTMLGERVLGLPPEPRVDRDVPWSSTSLP